MSLLNHEKSNFMKYSIVFLFIVSICFIGCNNDDSFSAGFTEMIEYDYFYETDPTITTTPINQSNHVQVGNAIAMDDGDDVIISIDGIRVQTDDSNYEIKQFIVEEDDGSGYREEFEFNVLSDNVKTDIASILVLDMSESVESISDELKSYAKDFASTIVNSSSNSVVSIVFFSARDEIEATPFFGSSDISRIHLAIDGYNNFLSKTALYEATNQAIDLMDGLTFDGEKSIVVFSDGGDNDSDNPTAQVDTIKASDTNRFTIGLRGNDFVENHLKNISSSNGQHVVAETPDHLQQIFRRISLGVVSIYNLKYPRSNQKLNQSEQIKIRIRMVSERI